MALATKATKALVSGTDGMLILEPGVMFQRKTNLPANWNKIRVGVMFSITNLVDANGAPTTELREAITQFNQGFFFGMSNGAGLPGTAGVKFAGIRPNLPSDGGYNYGNSICQNGSSEWSMRFNASIAQNVVTALINGTTFNTGNRIAQEFVFGAPTATSAFMSAFVYEFTADQSASTFAVSVLTGNPWSKLSDPSDNALMLLLTKGVASSLGTAASAWWPALPTGVQYLCMRFPFLLNRIRIHNTMVLDISTY